MASFEEILAKLHDDARLVDDAVDTPITVTNQRQFEVPNGYDLVLGYAGDVNSQIVTFKLPRKHESHDLYACAYKKLKWKNLASGAEGTSTLTAADPSEIAMTATWEVPPQAMTQAGNIEVAISLYDVSENGAIAFSWNTATFSGFKVGASFVHIGEYWDNGKMPAKNEILNVDTEGRQIVAPANYNKIICNYGDIGTSKVFFAIDKNIRGIDVSDEAAAMYVNVQFGTEVTEWMQIPKDNFKPYSENADKVIACWDVPAKITNNNYGYIGNISISLKFEVKDGNGDITKRWVSSSFTQLTIGPSLLTNTVIDIAERNEDLVREMVAEAVDEVIDKEVDEYFDEHNFVVEA